MTTTKIVNGSRKNENNMQIICPENVAIMNKARHRINADIDRIKRLLNAK